MNRTIDLKQIPVVLQLYVPIMKIFCVVSDMAPYHEARFVAVVKLDELVVLRKL